jgi:replication-associated recombination protein RarA
MKELGYGEGYKWTDEKEFHEKIDFLPKNLKNKKYYKFKNNSPLP